MPLQRPVLSSSSKRHLDGPAPLERPHTRSLALSPPEITTGRPRHALWTQQDARVRRRGNPRTWFWRLLVIVVVPLAAQGRRTYIASQRRPTGTALVVHLESTSSRASSGHISLGLGTFWSIHARTTPDHIVVAEREGARPTDISDTPAEPSVHRGIRSTGLTFSLRSAPPPLPRTVDGSDHTPRGRHSRTGFAIASLLHRRLVAGLFWTVTAAKSAQLAPPRPTGSGEILWFCSPVFQQRPPSTPGPRPPCPPINSTDSKRVAPACALAHPPPPSSNTNAQPPPGYRLPPAACRQAESGAALQGGCALQKYLPFTVSKLGCTLHLYTLPLPVHQPLNPPPSSRLSHNRCPICPPPSPTTLHGGLPDLSCETVLAHHRLPNTRPRVTEPSCR